MKIVQALNAINVDNAVPVIEFRGYLFHIDVSGYGRGMLYYTKFEKDARTPIHSVHMPFATHLTLGETIDRGEGLQAKIVPMITELPEATNTVIDVPAKPIVTFFNRI